MINLVIALKCEAKPLIRRYGLKPAAKAGLFPVYQTENMRLILSGPGKMAAREAVISLSDLAESKKEAWLNIGTGGSGEFPVGKGVLAHKITDRASQKSWYPPMIFQGQVQKNEVGGPVPNYLCETAAILTVEDVEEKYIGAWVYEMEAAGFYGAAVRYSSAELIHCYKVISDNHILPTQVISAPFVEVLLEKHLGMMDQLIEKISTLSDQLNEIQKEPAELPHFLREWHFTFSEQVQLKKLLRRWQALDPKESVWTGELLALDSANEVIRFLQGRFSRNFKL